jgi:hypothetical protein
MPYYPPDTPPEAPGQMPQASTPGPAPVPYGGGTDQRPEPPVYSVPGVSAGLAPGAGVLDMVPGGSPLAAPNPNPYEAGAPSPVMFPGDADPGGRDIVAGAVAGAVAAAQARFGELQGDTYGLGSHVGDIVTLPPSPLDPGAGPGLTDPAGHYYDPPRNYGDEPS